MTGFLNNLIYDIINIKSFNFNFLNATFYILEHLVSKTVKVI